MPQRLTWIEDGNRLRVTLVRIIEADTTNIPELRNIPTTNFLKGEVGGQKPKMTIILTFLKALSVSIVEVQEYKV